MKKTNSIIYFIAGLVVLIYGILLFSIKEMDTQRISLNYKNEKLQKDVDSLLTLIEKSEQRVDTIWQTLHIHRIRYDTIIKSIPIMQPTEQLAIVDSLTGYDIEMSVISGENALIKLPRIERIAIRLIERDKYQIENSSLHGIIIEQDGQLTAFKDVAATQNEQIELITTELIKCEEDVQILEKRRNFERIAGGLLLILILIIK